MASRKHLAFALAMLTLTALVFSACGQAAPPATPAASSPPTQSSAPAAASSSSSQSAPPAKPAATAAPAAKTSALDSLVEAAKKEGKLTVYASYTADQGKEIHAAFNQKYPFIQFEHTVLGAGDVTTRVLLESRSGTAGADLALTGAGLVAPIIKEGFAKKVDWAALGAAADVVGSPYQITVATVTFPIIWNTKLVPSAEAPKKWEDLLDPKWKGKVGLWANPSPLAYLAGVWGEAKATEYTQKLMQNEPVVMRGGADMAAQVGAGAVPVALSIDATLRVPMKAGAPIEWALLDPVPVDPYHAIIPTLAQHPNAATLYALWLASPDGAEAYEKATGRGNVFVSGSPMAQKAKGETISTFSVDKLDKYDALMKQLTSIIVP